jgi:hypothetical protein
MLPRTACSDYSTFLFSVRHDVKQGTDIAATVPVPDAASMALSEVVVPTGPYRGATCSRVTMNQAVSIAAAVDLKKFSQVLKIS